MNRLIKWDSFPYSTFGWVPRDYVIPVNLTNSYEKRLKIIDYKCLLLSFKTLRGRYVDMFLLLDEHNSIKYLDWWSSQTVHICKFTQGGILFAYMDNSEAGSLGQVNRILESSGHVLTDCKFFNIEFLNELIAKLFEPLVEDTEIIL